MAKPDGNPKARAALFQKREIRRTLHHDEWWFVIADIIVALTDSAAPSEYWKKMRKRDPDLGKALQGGTICPPCVGVRDSRRAAETPVLEHRRHLPPDPVHRFTQSRTVQAPAESLNMQLRKVLKNRGHFPSEEAAGK